MTIWALLNGAAWGASAILLLAMLSDFIKTELKARAEKQRKPGRDTPPDPT